MDTLNLTFLKVKTERWIDDFGGYVCKIIGNNLWIYILQPMEFRFALDNIKN